MTTTVSFIEIIIYQNPFKGLMIMFNQPKGSIINFEKKEKRLSLNLII